MSEGPYSAKTAETLPCLRVAVYTICRPCFATAVRYGYYGRWRISRGSTCYSPLGADEFLYAIL